MNIKILGMFIGIAILVMGIGFAIIKFREEKEEREDREESSIIEDYDIYELSIGERVKYGISGGAMTFITIYAFYHSFVVAGIAALIIAAINPMLKKPYLVDKRKKELTSQFKDAITYVADSLEVGNSVENGIRDAVVELENNFGEESYIAREFRFIVMKLNNGNTVDQAIFDVARRSRLEDIKNFAQVFETCRRTSGNVRSVIKRTSEIIREKDQVMREVELMVADKKFEQKILNMVPVMMILLLSAMAGDFIGVMYTSMKGRTIMTVVLIMYLLSAKWSKSIMDIEV